MIEQETVVDADREAAANAVQAYRDRKNADWQQRIRDGKCDDGEMVQAFARHRASSIPKMAVAGEMERLRERIGREAKDWRHNAYTRVMLAEMHDRLAVLAQGGGA